jgi:hypothetical protein
VFPSVRGRPPLKQKTWTENESQQENSAFVCVSMSSIKTKKCNVFVWA